ncbi:MAG TPA: glycosyl transferase [Deltaproteobacteria bacterium]|nr:glycosyl transferase [Deltaproteobacteria bacterium]HCP45599.1 glycosyl transferase [Deltaproteobacteria bacterium]
MWATLFCACIPESVIPDATPQLSLVVPAYNEERRLPETLPRAIAYLEERRDPWEIRVVDDGSSDGTCDIVESIAAGDPRVVLQREPHRGKGGAVRAGMLASKADYRFLCDADFSMPVAEVERFLPPYLGNYDIAIGSREGPGALRVGEPWRRHAMGRVFNRMIQTLLLPGVADSQCGFKCFTAHAAELLFPQQTVDGFAFDVEILFLARQAGLEVVEVPITWHYMDESSVHPVRDTWRMGREVLRIRARHGLGRYR